MIGAYSSTGEIYEVLFGLCGPLCSSAMLCFTFVWLHPDGADCVEFSIWQCGNIGMDQLCSKLHDSVVFAVADYIMEHFLLPHSLTDIEQAAFPQDEHYDLIKSHLAGSAVLKRRYSLPEMQHPMKENHQRVSLRVSLPPSNVSSPSQGVSLPSLPLLDVPSPSRAPPLSHEKLELLNDSMRDTSSAEQASEHMNQTIPAPNIASIEEDPTVTELPSITVLDSSFGHSASSPVANHSARLHEAFCRAMLLIQSAHDKGSLSCFHLSCSLPVCQVTSSALQELMELMENSPAHVSCRVYRQMDM